MPNTSLVLASNWLLIFFFLQLGSDKGREGGDGERESEMLSAQGAGRAKTFEILIPQCKSSAGFIAGLRWGHTSGQTVPLRDPPQDMGVTGQVSYGARNQVLGTRVDE